MTIEPVLNLHYRKKNLLRLIWLSVILFAFLLGTLFFIALVLIFKLESGVTTSSSWILIITLIFSACSIKLIRILGLCISEYKIAPRVAYSLSNDGISSSRDGWFLSWGEISECAYYGEGISFRQNKKTRFLLKSWGIDHEEMVLAKQFIFTKLPADKTKRLK